MLFTHRKTLMFMTISYSQLLARSSHCILTGDLLILFCLEVKISSMIMQGALCLKTNIILCTQEAVWSVGVL